MLNRSITPVPGHSPFLVRCFGPGTPRSNVFPADTREQAVGIAKARGLSAMILARRGEVETLVGVVEGKVGL